MPLIVIASASRVPSISTSPEKSPVAASNSPVKVTFLKPDISLFESTITANEADIVPAVIPSTKFNSAAVDETAVLPKVKPPSGITTPLPDKAVNVFAVNLKSSAPAILISI